MRSLALFLCGLPALLIVGLAIVPRVLAAPPAQEPIYLPLLAQAEPPSDNAPLDVVPQLDPARAVSVTLPLRGGEVVATGDDGTRFTLTVPADALAYTTTVTLTPIMQIAGLPDAQLVAAVQIEPVGLTFLQAATLRIEPAAAIPVAAELPFAFYAEGENFHAYPILPYTAQWSYPLGQIDGGYGMARTTGAAAQAQSAAQAAPAYTPSGPEAQLRAAVAQVIQQERSRVLGGQEPDPDLWSEKLRPLVLEYYKQVIQPFLEPSKTDCDVAEANMHNALGWLRQVQLLVGDEISDPELAAAADAIMNAFVAAIRNCYREAAQPCMDWGDPVQVRDVLGYYRSLALLGATEGEVAPFELPECVTVDVRLGAGGSFHYEFEPDDETGYATVYNFRIVDDNVSGIGLYNPFGGMFSEVRAQYTSTVLIDGEWHLAQPLQRFFCRDKKAERIEAWKVVFSNVEGEPEVPPQLYADNIGCWRWTGTIRYDWEYTEGAPELTYYANTFANVTFERKDDLSELDAGVIYMPYLNNGDVYVPDRHYRLLSAGTVQYDELWRYVTEDYFCENSLTLNLTDLSPYLDSDWPALEVPNAGFGAPRELHTGSGSALEVNAPYTKSGDCGPKDMLQEIRLSVGEAISADGRSVKVDETGPLGEQSGTFHRVIDLKALRQE